MTGEFQTNEKNREKTDKTDTTRRRRGRGSVARHSLFRLYECIIRKKGHLKVPSVAV